MRVGIDYFPAATHGPGVGRYARELVRALVRLEPEEPELELRLFDVGRGARALPVAALGLEGARARRVRLPLPRRVLARLGVGADTLLGGVELFHHVLADPPPVGRALQTMAVSELPERGSPASARLVGMDAVFAFSDDAARRLVEEHALDARRVMRLPVGCEHFRRDAPGDATPTDPLELLVLGSLVARREPLALLAGFERMLAGGVEARLRILGRRGSDAEAFLTALERSPARGHVELLFDPSERDLPPALARAAALVHLSRAEGTAVTPLEAFAFGLPVVVSPLPAFREALGDEALYADADDVDALAASLARALTDRPERRVARLALAAEHSWERNARATLEAWRALLSPESGRARPGKGASPRNQR